MQIETNISPKVRAALEVLQNEPSADQALAGAAIAAAEGEIRLEDNRQMTLRAGGASVEGMAVSYGKQKEKVVASLRADLADAKISETGIDAIVELVETMGFAAYGNASKSKVVAAR